MPGDAWIDSVIDIEEAAALTAHLVAIRSYPGEEGNVQRAIAAWLTENGIEAEFQATEGDRPNVLAWVRNGPGPTIFLMGTSIRCSPSTAGPPTRGRDGATATGSMASAHAT